MRHADRQTIELVVVRRNFDWKFGTQHNITYSFITNCQTAVVHKNKTKRRSKIYKSQYVLRYSTLTVKLQSVFEICGRSVAVYCGVYF